jgi:hypothetical protein
MATSVQDSVIQALSGPKLIAVSYLNGSSDQFEVEFVSFGVGQVAAIDSDGKYKVKISAGKYPFATWTGSNSHTYHVRLAAAPKYLSVPTGKADSAFFSGRVYGPQKDILGAFRMSTSRARVDQAAGAWVGSAKVFGKNYPLTMKLSVVTQETKGCSHGELNGVFSMGAYGHQRITMERCDEEGTFPYSFSGFAFDDKTGESYYLGIKLAYKQDMLVGVVYVTNADTQETSQGPASFKKAPTLGY